jgi:hypothetical protein
MIMIKSFFVLVNFLLLHFYYLYIIIKAQLGVIWLEYCKDMNLDFQDLLDDYLFDELEWLTNEFNYLFKNQKASYTKADLDIANHIIRKISEINAISNNEKAVELITWTIEKIKLEYNALFSH